MTGGLVAQLGDATLRPVTRGLARMGVRPVVANVLELSSAVAAGACFAAGWKTAGLAQLILHGLCDYLDGGLRRAAAEWGHAPAGDPPCQRWRATLIHTVTDKLSDVALFLLLPAGGLAPWWLGVTAAGASIAASALGLWADARGAGRREASIFDRSDRILAFLVLAAFGQFQLALHAALAMGLVVILQRFALLAFAAVARR